ncbi:MAG TPA: hypothetical protein VFW47_09880 [Phenylobacterium sp.]|nr:hypothetical protein [Phenylobacterium sp.]
MRPSVGGLALAAILVLSGCSSSESAPAGPVALSLPLTEGGHGVLPAQTAEITVKGKAADYSQTVSMTPNWWVGGGEFKVVWYSGLSQTKRYFTFAGEKGDPADRPAFLKNPEEGVREVKVGFDGGLPMSVHPTTTRAMFKIPAGAKAVTSVEVDFGPTDAPKPFVWK